VTVQDACRLAAHSPWHAAAIGERPRRGNFRSIPALLTLPGGLRGVPTGCPISQQAAAQNGTSVHVCRWTCSTGAGSEKG
jgi:hypothetical protein